jgi:hypothetical protein
MPSEIATLGRPPRPAPAAAVAAPRIEGALRLDRWVLILLILGTLGRLVFVYTAPTADLIVRSTDDAYYYFNVARNIVLGFGVTFDRMNPTNGFHPLWMLCMLPIYWLAGSDPETGLRAVLGVVTLVTGGGLWFAYRAIGQYTTRTAAALGTSVLLVPAFLNSFLNGLETGLLLLLIFVTVSCISRFDLLSLRAGVRRNTGLGLLLAAVVLCRLDSIFIAAAIYGSFFVRWWTQADGRLGLRAALIKTFQVAAPPILLVGAYLVWNRVVFGHLMPISGALKSTFPVYSFVVARLFDPHRLYGEVQLVFSAAVLVWIHLSRRREGSTPDGPPNAGVPLVVAALWVGNFLHFVHTMAYMSWAAHWWHFASYLPVTTISAALLFDRVHSRSRRPAMLTAAAAIAMAFVILVGFRIETLIKGEHHQPWFEAAMWTRANLPADAVVGIADAGVFGYFSGRRTVNLDGVINGFEYQEALRDHRLGEFLRASHVTHIADYEVRYRNGAYAIKLPASLYKRPGGAIEATETAEIYASAPYRETFRSDRQIHYAIWPLEKVRVVDDVGQLAP